MTGGPGKEHGINKPPPIRRVRKRSKADTTCPTTSQNPPLWRPSCLNKACTARKDSESEWLAKDNLQAMRQSCSSGSRTPCSPPGGPFLIKFLGLSAHVSPGTIHFWVLDKNPGSGPGRGPPSCNRTRFCMPQLKILFFKKRNGTGQLWKLFKMKRNIVISANNFYFVVHI